VIAHAFAEHLKAALQAMDVGQIAVP